MKTTVFTEHHIAAGAKMAEFAGYNMPIEFTGINDEHMAVRQRAGVFDVSHMGEIWVKGPKAEALLQRITTNDVAKLFDGKVQYSCMPNGRGGIVDDILVYRVDAGTYMLCVNAANIDKDWAHICAEGAKMGMEAGHGKELYNASDEICQLAVQGPLAMKIVQELCAEPVEEMAYYTFRKTEVAGCDAILSITGYTGAGGCEIYVANEDGEKLWQALWKAGEKYGLQNIGLGARDTLRLEKGFCLYGNDIDDTTSPIEAGLGWIGRQSLLVTPCFGTYVLLGELLLTDEADRYDAPFEESRCGSCRRCLDSCPSGALAEPYEVDARRCISRHTVERETDGRIDLGGWIFGCDACQSCCPYNRQAPMHALPAFDPLFDPVAMGPAEWLAMDEATFDARLGATPLARSGLRRLQRNLRPEAEPDAGGAAAAANRCPEKKTADGGAAPRGE